MVKKKRVAKVRGFWGRSLTGKIFLTAILLLMPTFLLNRMWDLERFGVCPEVLQKL